MASSMRSIAGWIWPILCWRRALRTMWLTSPWDDSAVALFKASIASRRRLSVEYIIDARALQRKNSLSSFPSTLEWYSRALHARSANLRSRKYTTASRKGAATSPDEDFSPAISFAIHSELLRSIAFTPPEREYTRVRRPHMRLFRESSASEFSSRSREDCSSTSACSKWIAALLGMRPVVISKQARESRLSMCSGLMEILSRKHSSAFPRSPLRVQNAP